MADRHQSTGFAQLTKVPTRSLKSATMILLRLTIRHLARNLQTLSEWALILREAAEYFQPKTLVSARLAAKSAINS